MLKPSYIHPAAIFQHIWMSCMDDGLEGVEELIWYVWELGLISGEEASKWSDVIHTQCPEGLSNHVGQRSWCAYCGDIYSLHCHECDEQFWKEGDRENLVEYSFLKEQLPYTDTPICIRRADRTGYANIYDQVHAWQFAKLYGGLPGEPNQLCWGDGSRIGKTVCSEISGDAEIL